MTRGRNPPLFLNTSLTKTRLPSQPVAWVHQTPVLRPHFVGLWPLEPGTVTGQPCHKYILTIPAVSYTIIKSKNGRDESGWCGGWVGWERCSEQADFEGALQHRLPPLGRVVDVGARGRQHKRAHYALLSTPLTPFPEASSAFSLSVAFFL